ncbi:MAG: phage tail tape measure protein [Saprospiraceae bacterium]
MAENEYSKVVLDVKSDIELLNSELKKTQEHAAQISKDIFGSLKGSGGNAKQLQKQIDSLNKKINKLTETKEKSIIVDGKIKVKQNELAKTYNALNKQKQKSEKENQKLLKSNSKLANEIKKQADKNKELSRAYVKLIAKQKQAKKTLQDLIVTQGKNSRATKKAQREYDRLSKKVNLANRATSNFSKKGLGSMARGFKNLLGAFGVIGGVQLLASAVRDTFKRVREFDKSMQNLAGVFRTTRKELKPLEEDIISVAGQSVKTSREVADLAESLATLGKTPEQIRKLLKPVVDLGIGLEATGEDAGEFLIQMLNAFGASDDEAMKYADTIATIRTSTTLDFQKMRDSFQYIAPISRLLGKDLAYTGSVVGILADNGLKAQQAGRVLGTSLQKLATQGLSLDDALEKINEATANGVKEVELLAMANRLLGAEGAKIGIVLAENKDIIDENTKSIRENSGALNDLVEQQMESLDAKLLVLDASWEKLIFRVENGRGVFSNIFKSAIDSTTDFINVLSDMNKVTEIIGENEDYSFWQKFIPVAGVTKGIKDFKRIRDATKEFQAIQKEFEQIDLTNLNEVYSAIDIWTEMKKEVKGNEGAVKSLDFFLNKLKETERSIYEQARNADDKKNKSDKLKRLGFTKDSIILEQLKSKLKDLNHQQKQLGDLSKLKTSDYDTWKNLTKEIKETESAIKELSGTPLPTVKYLKGSLAYYEAQISKAETAIKNTARTTEEYEKQKKVIDELKIKLKSLKKEFGIGVDETRNAVEVPDTLPTPEIDTTSLDLAKLTKEELQAILLMEELKLKLLNAGSDAYMGQMNTIESIKVLLDDLPENKVIISPKNSEELEKLRKKLELIDTAQEAFGLVTDTFSDMFDIDTSKFDFIFDSLKDKTDELFSGDNIVKWGELSKEIIGGVLNASMQRYDIELQEAQRVRDVTLNNDLATDEAKQLARRKFEIEEREIKTRRAKEERKNALIQIAVDTAIGVASSLKTPFLIPFIVGLGAAQAAIVASQPLPQFYKGVENSSYEGWATKDERGAEIQLDKYGNIKDLGQNNGSKYTYVEKGDTIIPAMKTKSILDSFDEGSVQRMVFDLNMNSNNEMLSKKQVDNSLLKEVSSLKSSNEKIWGEVKKLASRPLNIKNVVELKDDRAY